MIEFMDGFDYLTAANGTLKWDTFSGVIVAGIFGRGQGVRGNFVASKTLAGNDVTGFQAFHLWTGTRPSGTTGGLCSFIDAVTTQVDVRMNNQGQLLCTRNGTLIGSAGASLNPNQWYWIEVKATINGATGEASIQVNGSAYLTQTGLNTQATANAFFNKIQVAGNFTGDQTQIFDNYHMFNSTAGLANDPSNFFGEHVIDSELANAVGASSQWGKGGTTINANNFQQVNEANEDGDATYVTTNVAGNIDEYGFASLVETTGTVAMVAVNTIDRKDDAGPHVMDHIARDSGGSVLLSAGVSPSASYQNHQSLFPQNPGGGTPTAWTIANRNNSQFGYEFIS